MITLYIASSVDGYIATKDGSVSWLDQFNELMNAEVDVMKNSYPNFIKDIDINIMGNKTYEQVLSFGIGWPYQEQENYIITNNKDRESLYGEKFIAFDELSDIDRNKNIWCIGGANIFTQMLELGYIDKLIIVQMPVILGEGISLFDTNNKKVDLDLVDVRVGNKFFEYEYLVK